MTAEDIPRFAACTAEAYRGYPLFDHLFGPAYNPSAVETIFGASIGAPAAYWASRTRPPRMSTTECSCRLWPMPGI